MYSAMLLLFNSYYLWRNCKLEYPQLVCFPFSVKDSVMQLEWLYTIKVFEYYT